MSFHDNAYAYHNSNSRLRNTSGGGSRLRIGKMPWAAEMGPSVALLGILMAFGGPIKSPQEREN